MGTADIAQPRSISDDFGKLLLRLALGGLMLFHGIDKIRHPDVEFIQDALKAANLPDILRYGAFVGEVLAPVLIIFGFWTRLAAVVVAINMMVAVYLVHAKDLLTLSPMGGWSMELQAWFFMGAVVLAFLGAGRISVSRGKGWLS